MKKIFYPAALLFFLLFYSAGTAQAQFSYTTCNSGDGSQYFICKNSLGNCTSLPMTSLGAAGMPDAKTYCETANTTFLGCTKSQNGPDECVKSKETTDFGCCIAALNDNTKKCFGLQSALQYSACNAASLGSGLSVITKFLPFIPSIPNLLKFDVTQNSCTYTQGCTQYTGAPPGATPGATPPAVGTTDALKDLLIKSPGISIHIPGLDFSNINQPDAEGYLYIPWLAEYLTALYKFLIGVVTIFAVVMIIIQGARIVTSGGGEAKMDAYKKIFRAIIGLVIAWGSYAILYNVNPDLVTFNALKVLYIKPELLPPGDPDNFPPNPDQGKYAKSSGPAMKPIPFPTSGDKSGNCWVLTYSNFPAFDISKFSDGSNGRCLLGLWGDPTKSANITRGTIFGKKTLGWLNVMTEPLQKAQTEIQQLQSPIVKAWLAQVTVSGPLVDVSGRSWADECQDKETVVVVNNRNQKNRRLTKIARVMYGTGGKVLSDLHAIGLAFDLNPMLNPDLGSKPMITNIPKEVATVFLNNGFAWGGGNWGRDPMHFEYRPQDCYGPVTVEYPRGPGCCIVDSSGRMSYSTCIGQGGKEATYDECLGPGGTPGSEWAQMKRQ